MYIQISVLFLPCSGVFVRSETIARLAMITLYNNMSNLLFLPTFFSILLKFIIFRAVRSNWGVMSPTDVHSGFILCTVYLFT